MTERSTDLYSALEADRIARQQAADEATRPERERIEQQAKADAGLYGTAGWDALGDHRQARARHYATQQAQGGGSDAA